MGTKCLGAERKEIPQGLRQSGKVVNFLEARSGVRAEGLRKTGPAGGHGAAGEPMLTFLAQQEGVEAQVVDSQVEPALPGHAALPVAAGIVVDQLLPLRHPKLLPHLQFGLLELPRVLLSLRLQVLVLFCNDTLEDKGTGSWRAQCSHSQDRQRQEEHRVLGNPVVALMTLASRP